MGSVDQYPALEGRLFSGGLGEDRIETTDSCLTVRLIGSCRCLGIRRVARARNASIDRRRVVLIHTKASGVADVARAGASTGSACRCAGCNV